jgi:hypothetical protein
MINEVFEQWNAPVPGRFAASTRSTSRFGCEARQAEDRDYEWRRVIRTIYRMVELRDDWDGLGASAPTMEVLSSAIRLAEDKFKTLDYPAPTRVVATPAGTVGFEWQQGSIYTEAEVVRSGHSEWMQLVPGYAPKHWTEPEIPCYEEIVSPAKAKPLPHVYWAISA